MEPQWIWGQHHWSQGPDLRGEAFWVEKLKKEGIGLPARERKEMRVGVKFIDFEITTIS